MSTQESQMSNAAVRVGARPRRSRLKNILTFCACLPGIAFSGAGTVAASAIVPQQKAMVAEPGNTLVVRTGEPDDATKICPTELETRGTKLRAELERVFAELLDSGKSLNRENDISASVVPYISAGMTFAESECVLRAAGFDVSPHTTAREERDPNGPGDRYAVLASIRNFSRRVLGSVEIYVTLYPKSPGDYSDVKDVDATIFIEHL
jgi:hypothetical protein